MRSTCAHSYTRAKSLSRTRAVLQKWLRARKQKSKQKCAPENGLLLLVSGLLALVCVALYRESKEHCQRTSFKKLGHSWTNG